MNCLWLYICVLIVVQQSNHSIVNAKEHGHGHGRMHGHGSGLRCCKVEATPETTQHVETIKGLFEECDKELGDPKPGERKERIICMSECLGNKTKILNEDRTVNEETFKEHVLTKMATHDFTKAIAADTATKCAAAAKDSSGENSSGCSKTTSKLMWCVVKEFFKACPTELQDQSERCVKMRERLNGNTPDQSEHESESASE